MAYFFQSKTVSIFLWKLHQAVSLTTNRARAGLCPRPPRPLLFAWRVPLLWFHTWHIVPIQTLDTCHIPRISIYWGSRDLQYSSLGWLSRKYGYKESGQSKRISWRINGRGLTPGIDLKADRDLSPKAPRGRRAATAGSFMSYQFQLESSLKWIELWRLSTSQET